jgi:acrylyl-CoA reductase (NADPH)
VHVPTFKAMVIEKADGGTKAALANFDEANLMDGDATVSATISKTAYSNPNGAEAK